jgi:hypothetical protein
MVGQASPVQQATTDRRLSEIELADRASQAFWAWVWLIFMLCTLEAARSLSLWALITDISANDAKRDRERSDELAELRHQQEVAALRGQMVPAAPSVAADPPPAPPEPEPEPAPEPPQEPLTLVDPPEPEMTAQQRNARQGGLAAQHERRAAKTERLLVIGPVSTLDQMKVAAE